MRHVSLPSHISVQDLIEFWSKAASETYASGKKPRLVGGGNKGMSFSEGLFGYEDVWYPVNGYAFGQTIILIEGLGIVWQMSYEGWMHPDAKSFLMEALQMGTVNFRGARGPMIHTSNGLIYMNDYAGEFTSFSGTEEIRVGSDTGKLLHQHSYRGRLLVTP